jgi:hypothetical protein
MKLRVRDSKAHLDLPPRQAARLIESGDCSLSECFVKMESTCVCPDLPGGLNAGEIVRVPTRCPESLAMRLIAEGWATLLPDEQVPDWARQQRRVLRLDDEPAVGPPEPGPAFEDVFEDLESD